MKNLELLRGYRGPAIALLLSGLGGFASPVSADTKVAYLGDQGAGSQAREVLRLLVDEGVDLLVLQGDLGYGDGVSAWQRMMEEELGSDFPVLSVAGNHDRHDWGRYQDWLEQRIDDVDELRCAGDVGVKALCTFRDIVIAQTAPAVRLVSPAGPDDDYAGYVRDVLGERPEAWKVCSFHKNQRDMQTGNKPDRAGWPIYEACRDVGAMVVTGHEHAYSRTHLLDDVEGRSVIHRDSTMALQPGQTVVVVSGLGGQAARPQIRGGDWWASIHTADQGASAGALICDYERTQAECRFVSIDGAVPDRFTLTVDGPAAEARDEPAEAERAATDVNADLAAGFVFERSDKDEHRWISATSSGELGSIWISEDCAARFEGQPRSGDWSDLMELAPAFDAVENPCLPTADARMSVDEGGFVFERSDKDEIRWIDRAADGRVGSIWISEDCARRLGVTARNGDWGDLKRIAPAFDQIANPCR